jgi:hypothetical protein
VSAFALLLALALPYAAADGSEAAPFEHLASFDTEAACDARLGEMADEARRGGWIAVEGPYQIAEGDRRIHMVRASGSGHGITECRCEDRQLSARSWRHSMGDAEPEQPETIESMAAKAEWLKRDRDR